MIELRHLTKRYGAHTAVDDLSFTIEKGAVYGLLGPNGAGKTTTMNIMTGCLAPTAGEVLIAGHDIFEEPLAAKRHIGYLPEQPPLYPDMTPREYLAFVARAKGVKLSALAAELDRVMEVTGVTGQVDRLIRSLSKGYRQRVGVAQAILGAPEAVILDEPTVGLDPLQIIEIRKLIRSLGREHTVILSSHMLHEVQTVCDQVLVIHQGRLAASGTPAELETRLSGQAAFAITVKAAVLEAREALESVEGVTEVTAEAGPDGRCALHVAVRAAAPDMDERLSFALSDRHIPVLGMTREQATLEDVFLALTREEKGEEHVGDL